MLSNLSESLLDLVFTGVTYITNFLLTPINALIYSLLPQTALDYAFYDINNFWDKLIDASNYAISFFGITQTELTALKYIWVYILTAPLLVFGVKLAISWYKAIKL